MSSGDALREVDQLGLIKSHFILVTGDVVSNFQLKTVIDAHR